MANQGPGALIACDMILSAFQRCRCDLWTWKQKRERARERLFAWPTQRCLLGTWIVGLPLMCCHSRLEKKKKRSAEFSQSTLVLFFLPFFTFTLFFFSCHVKGRVRDDTGCISGMAGDKPQHEHDAVLVRPWRQDMLRYEVLWQMSLNPMTS